MGKTQFSFILARIHPVFYFNFSDLTYDAQEIYLCFKKYRDELMETLTWDDKLLSNENDSTAPLESVNLFNQPNLKMLTIGFIWSLIEHSMNFDFDRNDGKWFEHYLQSRSSPYEALSFNNFYAKMGKSE